MPGGAEGRRPTVVMMAKAPAVGRGKQRLARDLGRVQAWRVNRDLQRRACRAAQAGPWVFVLCVSPDRALKAVLPGVWPPTPLRRPQGRGDLGMRIAAGMHGLRGPVVVVGADCPAMGVADLAAAFKALRRCPSVLGPAADGGFWLVGAQDPKALVKALPGVRWSTPNAGADMIQRLPGPVARLRVLADIDDAASWRAYRSSATYKAGRPDARD
jgi:glycosyltransferase A (GT-A) superfamily protein (DUF2064 family)